MAKILVVDDSGMSRRTLRRLLESEGHQVAEANDGMSALEQYALNRPELVMLDMVMTGMDGMEVLNKLREMDKQVRIIVATADIQSSTREMVTAAGALGFVTKPFVAELLIAAINEALAGGGNDFNRAAK